MSTFAFLKNIFGGDRNLSEEQQDELFKELLFLTLSRASRSDLDISSVEISKIQSIIKAHTGDEPAEQEIRTAGMSELYEDAPLERYAVSAGRRLNAKRRQEVLTALFEVIAADGRLSPTEADFFDSIAEAMRLRPFEIAGGILQED